MTLGFLPQMREMTDRQPSWDMQKNKNKENK